jgi:hypothetical protein
VASWGHFCWDTWGTWNGKTMKTTPKWMFEFNKRDQPLACPLVHCKYILLLEYVLFQPLTNVLVIADLAPILTMPM